jgi:hypothetical protein
MVVTEKDCLFPGCTLGENRERFKTGPGSWSAQEVKDDLKDHHNFHAIITNETNAQAALMVATTDAARQV